MEKAIDSDRPERDLTRNHQHGRTQPRNNPKTWKGKRLDKETEIQIPINQVSQFSSATCLAFTPPFRIYEKKKKIVGYVVGEKVWCEYCWEAEKPEKPGEPVTVKDLRKNDYVCDSCGGTIPVAYEYRLAKCFDDPKIREELRKRIRDNIEGAFSDEEGETE